MTRIKIAYRQLIDSKSTKEFEKKLFNDSFNEFYLQSQAYNAGGKWKTFSELVEHNPKANSLHYKVGFSVGRYISELKNIIPILKDSIGKSVSFETHEFQLIYSDISNKAVHQVAIIYTSGWLELLAVAGPCVVVGVSSSDNGCVSTLTIPLQNNLSIVEWSQQGNQKLNVAV